MSAISAPPQRYTRVAQLRTAPDFRAYLADVGASLEFDDEVLSGAESPLAQTLDSPCGRIGNRWAILPMEGWDSELDGNPSELNFRRWQRFGESGAKLIWGAEAVAVRHDGRANPNQLIASENTLRGLTQLRETLVKAHHDAHGKTDDLIIGLQLTHSGRYCKPNHTKKFESRTAYAHPLLDKKYNVPPSAEFSDDEIDAVIEDFGRAARVVQRAGFHFIDLKHCHGYLAHELLTAVKRVGKYGGSFENRTRFFRNAVESIRANAPGIQIGVRLSIYDFAPFIPGPDQKGVMEDWRAITQLEKYPFAFGGDGSGQGIDLSETNAFIQQMKQLGVTMLCATAGSPYYTPHVQRPAFFPPSDGYQLVEDPLVGCARMIHATAILKQTHPDMLVVGTGYSYLQEWLPNVAQHAVRTGAVDSVGIGRMVLTYPEMPSDVIQGKPLRRKQVCRTFSDCTTGPRKGLVSGCYPLDDRYKHHPHKALLDAAKATVS
jgi:2,4-dienoyl-CoA reductase-like NADH-dependent reductase (Old Yellow Enzyme family)